MTLADLAIKRALNRQINPLIIDPLSPENLGPCSYDLTLGTKFIYGNSGSIPLERIDLDEKGKEYFRDNFWINPGEFLLAETVERVEIPTDLVGRLEGKSSIGRLGLLVHITAGFIDAGFKGIITLEMVNLSKWPIKLTPGMKICQISFHQLTEHCERPYGSPGLGSHYQNQEGVTESVLSPKKKDATQTR